ncbi:hypothetical protein [Streptomyces fulvoviolaceus]|uniref:hypothetical protein n=1 Tax=Streptomyces fulvoviolaceus TaxID=285535 RepID=UPI0021C095E3|nr:hypothetical protein [Streptomyces fulvoviolaceus]MCT9078523.1 hypothetical protein [Streptomyces fulvoviolaceus]
MDKEAPDDELMAVLLGEPSPGPGGEDAERDMAAVRDQLRWIGDGLARAATQQPEREPVPVRRKRRWPLFALAASVVVGLLGTGTMYLVAHNGTLDGGSQSLLTYEGLIACSSAVAEGTVERVDPVGGDRYRVTLDVDRYYKPASGERRLTFTEEGANVPAYYKTGVRMLVLVSSLPGEGPESYSGDDLAEGRRDVEDALPGAQGIKCDGPG